MGSGPRDGYQADFGGLRKRTAQADGFHMNLEEVYDALTDVLYQEAYPLGDDQYGAELEKQRQQVETTVHATFKAYLSEISSLGGGLLENRRSYEAAEDAWEAGPTDSSGQ